MYHPTALDIWGQNYKRIFLDEFASDLEMQAHEQVAMVYAFAYSAAIAVTPRSKEVITNIIIMDNILKLPMSKVLVLTGEPDVGTSWGLAKASNDQMTVYPNSDGWNADGSLTHEFNKMPFSDFDYEEYFMYKTPSQTRTKYSKTKLRKQNKKTACNDK